MSKTIPPDHPHYELFKSYMELTKSGKAPSDIWVNTYCWYKSPYLKEPKHMTQLHIVLCEMLVLFSRDPTKLLAMDFKPADAWYNTLSLEKRAQISQSGQSIEACYLMLSAVKQKYDIAQFANSLIDMYESIKKGC